MRYIQQSSLLSSAGPGFIQSPKRLKLTRNPPPPPKPPQQFTQQSYIGPLPNSGPIQSTEKALAAYLRLMTPNQRAEFRFQPSKGKQEHRAGLYWIRPGPSPLGSDLTKTRSPSPPPSVENQTVINFGPFAPSGSPNVHKSGSVSKKRIVKIRIIPPKLIPQPESAKRGLLLPEQFTYLRPGPSHRTPDLDSEALMGPPKPRHKIDTPYQTVKKALTFLKSELSLTTYPNLTYPVAKITPNLCSSVEDVIMELDEFVFSIAKTSSSDEMKVLLMLFQKRLGLPSWPPFYKMLWFSPLDLLDHLADNFVSDMTDDENDDV